jgi:hypothetical protein
MWSVAQLRPESECTLAGLGFDVGQLLIWFGRRNYESSGGD